MDAAVCNDSMEDIVSGLAVRISASRFLVHVKLTFVNQWVAPLDQVDFVNCLVAVVVDDDICVHGLLNGLHPMCMDDAGGYHLPVTSCGDNKTEFQHF